MEFLVSSVEVEGIIGMAFRSACYALTGCLSKEGDAISLADKERKLLANKVQVVKPTTLPAGVEVPV